MNSEDTGFRLALGAGAGLLGTFVIQGFLTASESLAPQALPPINQDPGEFMIEQVEKRVPSGIRRAIPAVVETSAAKSLAIGYGATFGALYGLSSRRRDNFLVDGGALGLGTWAIGYLGWLPASGLMPPLTKQNPSQIAGPLLSHLLFGVATAALYRLLRTKL